MKTRGLAIALTLVLLGAVVLPTLCAACDPNRCPVLGETKSEVEAEPAAGHCASAAATEESATGKPHPSKARPNEPTSSLERLSEFDVSVDCCAMLDATTQNGVAEPAVTVSAEWFPETSVSMEFLPRPTTWIPDASRRPPSPPPTPLYTLNSSFLL